MSPPAVRPAAERVKLKHDSKLSINNSNPHQFVNSGKPKHWATLDTTSKQ